MTLLSPPPVAAPTPSPLLFSITPWRDPVVESVGFDPRSVYVERFWLPILGPSAILLMRRLADRFDRSPDGFELDVGDAARAFGLGRADSVHSPLRRALSRSVRYGLLRPRGGGTVEARRALAPLPERLVLRLPPSLRQELPDWDIGDRHSPTLELARRRARLLALDLLDAEATTDAVERRLARLEVHPSLAHEAAQWAWQRQLEAASVVSASLSSARLSPAATS